MTRGEQLLENILTIIWFLCGVRPVRTRPASSKFSSFLLSAVRNIVFLVFASTSLLNVVTLLSGDTLYPELKLGGNFVWFVLIWRQASPAMGVIFVYVGQNLTTSKAIELRKLIKKSKLKSIFTVNILTFIAIIISFGIHYFSFNHIYYQQIRHIPLSYTHFMMKMYGIYLFNTIAHFKKWMELINKDLKSSLRWIRIKSEFIQTGSCEATSLLSHVSRFRKLRNIVNIFNRTNSSLLFALVFVSSQKLISIMYFFLIHFLFDTGIYGNMKRFKWGLVNITIALMELYAVIFPAHYFLMEFSQFKEIIIACCGTSDPETRRILYFLKLHPTKFSPFDLFTLNLRLLPKILAAVIVYLVIVLQLQGDDGDTYYD